MQRVNKKPVDHFEGKWRKDRKYTLFAVVENNGSLFRSLTVKPKQEPYVIYNAENETFVANDGWELVRLSKDSEISSGGNLTLRDLATALEKVVSVESQSLTDEQKAQVIENIGALGSIEEYVIAQALNDLNERIEALQLNISQNDIIIKMDSIEELPDDNNAKQQILDAYSKGKLLSVILIDGNSYGSIGARIIGYSATEEAGKYSLYIRYYSAADTEEIQTFVGQVDELYL